jgi:hypothetical protein
MKLWRSVWGSQELPDEPLGRWWGFLERGKNVQTKKKSNKFVFSLSYSYFCTINSLKNIDNLKHNTYEQVFTLFIRCPYGLDGHE